MRCRWVFLLVLFAASLASRAEGIAVHYPPAGPAFTPGAVLPKSIPGTLSFPQSTKRPVPAVVIAHASGGLSPQGPEPAYVTALNTAGIATLVIDMWTPRGIPSGPAALGAEGGQDRRPPSIRDTLPDAFGALKFLAAQPGIDPKRIGIMGFSWGAMLSVLSLSERAAARALDAGPRFAGHSAHYPVCSAFLPGAPLAPALEAPWTGARLQILAGGKDDYDNEDGGAGCRRLLDELTPEIRSRVELVVYPDATHAWEEVNLPFAITIRDPRSHHGRGGSVRIAPDPEDSAKARAATVAFFRKAFGL